MTIYDWPRLTNAEIDRLRWSHDPLEIEVPWTTEPPTVSGWYWWRHKVYTPTGDVEEKAICVREECTMTYFAVAGE